MKNHAIALTHHESGYRNTTKVTRYVPQAQRKPALMFTLRELVDALPLSTYTHTIWFSLFTFPITLWLIEHLSDFAGAAWLSKSPGAIGGMAFLLTVGCLAVVTFSKDGKRVRREIRAKFLRRTLQRPHLLLTEEMGSYRVCRLGLMRRQEVDKSSTVLVPKDTYIRLEELSAARQSESM